LAAAEAELNTLMSRLARGDRSAFDPLYAALRPRALRVAQRQVGAADAADVTQAALMKVFFRASEFTAERACLPWFYAIVANEVQATRRRGARLVLDAAAGEGRVGEQPDAETQLLRLELERALELAIEKLDADAAHAIHSLLGRAAPSNVTPATLRKRVSRAYEKLRLLLGGHDAS
jgi:RNA polymerase sigma-70 factor (ECF subfamily)